MKTSQIIVLIALALGVGIASVGAVADGIKADPFFAGPDQNLKDFTTYSKAFLAGQDTVTTSDGQTFKLGSRPGKIQALEAYQPIQYVPPELNTAWFQKAQREADNLNRICTG